MGWKQKKTQLWPDRTCREQPPPERGLSGPAPRAPDGKLWDRKNGAVGAARRPPTPRPGQHVPAPQGLPPHNTTASLTPRAPGLTHPRPPRPRCPRLLASARLCACIEARADRGAPRAHGRRAQHPSPGEGPRRARRSPRALPPRRRQAAASWVSSCLWLAPPSPSCAASSYAWKVSGTERDQGQLPDFSGHWRPQRGTAQAAGAQEAADTAGDYPCVA